MSDRQTDRQTDTQTTVYVNTCVGNVATLWRIFRFRLLKAHAISCFYTDEQYLRIKINYLPFNELL